MLLLPVRRVTSDSVVVVKEVYGMEEVKEGKIDIKNISCFFARGWEVGRFSVKELSNSKGKETRAVRELSGFEYSCPLHCRNGIVLNIFKVSRSLKKMLEGVCRFLEDSTINIFG